MQGSKAAAFLFTHATSLTNPDACLLIVNNATYFVSFAFIGVRGRRPCHRGGVEQSLCVLEGQGGRKASSKVNKADQILFPSLICSITDILVLNALEFDALGEKNRKK